MRQAGNMVFCREEPTDVLIVYVRGPGGGHRLYYNPGMFRTDTYPYLNEQWNCHKRLKEALQAEKDHELFVLENSLNNEIAFATGNSSLDRKIMEDGTYGLASVSDELLDPDIDAYIRRCEELIKMERIAISKWRSLADSYRESGNLLKEQSEASLRLFDPDVLRGANGEVQNLYSDVRRWAGEIVVLCYQLSEVSGRIACSKERIVKMI